MSLARRWCFVVFVCSTVLNVTVWAHFDVTPEQGKILIDTYDALCVIDVRDTDTEYCETGHVLGAKNLPLMSGVFEAQLSEIPKDTPILVMCKSGYRSNLAAEILDSEGYLLVFDLWGGFMGWTGPKVKCVDIDQDGVFDDTDTCPCDADPNQVDTDGDGIGDVCDEDTPNQTYAHVDITVAEALALVDANIPHLILDVRRADEFCNPATEHIPGAVNYNFTNGDLEANLDDIPKDTILIVQCHSGYRSNLAAEFLDDNGYAHVYDMLGGIMAWRNAGAPTVPCDPVDANEG